MKNMKKIHIFIMALMALVGTACQKAEEGKAPITKPQITIEGGLLTPEGLWAMGRIGSVKSDIETGWLAYTVSYYSVAENRSTSWIRICDPFNGLTDEGMKGSGEWRDEVAQDYPGYEVLVQLDEDDELGLRFYDCGTLFFLIRPEDLAARNFENVKCVLYSY